MRKLAASSYSLFLSKGIYLICIPLEKHYQHIMTIKILKYFRIGRVSKALKNYHENNSETKRRPTKEN
jgi:hypothetical protein